MTLKFSTGFRNKQLGNAEPEICMVVGNTISFDNASGEIRDSASGFVTAKIVAGMTVYIGGTTSNNGTKTITSVTAGALATSEGVVDEAAGTVFVVAAGKGGSVRDILENGVIKTYTGNPPAGGPDAAIVGTLLCTYTLGSGTFTPGAETNGLELGDAADAMISKKSTEIWSGVGLAAGVAGSFRFCGNAEDTGAASTTLPRIDGTVGLKGTGADWEMTSTTFAVGATYTVDRFDLFLPEYYGAV